MSKVEAYLRVKDVARYVGLSLDGVQELIDNGELETMELNGQVKIRKSEVDRWLDEQVNIESLLDLTDKLEGEIDIEEVASSLDMEVEEVRKKLNKDSEKI